MKAPPPSPEDCGSTRLRTNCTAMAASAALPPARSMSRPASTAAGLAAEIMKDFASPIPPAARDPVAASGATERSWAAADVAPAPSAMRAATAQARMGLGVANMLSGILVSSRADVVRLFKTQGNPVGIWLASWGKLHGLFLGQSSIAHVA